MKLRYSIEYCGMKYTLLNRTTNIIEFEASTFDEVQRYRLAKSITLINDDK